MKSVLQASSSPYPLVLAELMSYLDRWHVEGLA